MGKRVGMDGWMERWMKWRNIPFGVTPAQVHLPFWDDGIIG